MSDDSNANDQTSIIRRPMPVWLAGIIIGTLLGGGVTFQVMRAVGYKVPDQNDTSMQAPMAGGGGGMGGGGMMGGGMMGGGMGGGGGAREKRSLTALVGKLQLLSKGLRIELDPAQADTIAAKLVELDQAEKMTGDEAQAHLDAMEEILTDEQKAALGGIELPRGGSSGGRGMGGGMMGGMGGMGGAAAPPAGAAGAAPGGGSPPPGMMGGGMMGVGGPPADENPFQQEANQKRLRDLMDRLRPSSAETSNATEEPVATEATEEVQSAKP
ncbi:MAG TPA: hypothetical protein VND64_34655 [Pirellulales bacterium]|nr:hypothetical protein [Pirellulales bacterium]